MKDDDGMSSTLQEAPAKPKRLPSKDRGAKKNHRGPWDRFAEVVGNIVALSSLTMVAILLLRATEGAWWLANPPADRWIWAAVTVVLYVAFCAWMMIPRRVSPANGGKSRKADDVRAID